MSVGLVIGVLLSALLILLIRSKATRALCVAILVGAVGQALGGLLENARIEQISNIASEIVRNVALNPDGLFLGAGVGVAVAIGVAISLLSR